MTWFEVECLRCGSIERDCDCADGFQGNPYDRINELQAEVARLKSMRDGLQQNLDNRESLLQAAEVKNEELQEEVERLRSQSRNERGQGENT